VVNSSDPANDTRHRVIMVYAPDAGQYQSNRLMPNYSQKIGGLDLTN